jgi:hypothetical protein
MKSFRLLICLSVFCISFLSACTENSQGPPTVVSLHGEYNGTFEKFVIIPLNIQNPSLNQVTRQDFKINVSRAGSESEVRIQPQAGNLGNSFVANVTMTISGGLLDINQQTQGTATIVSADPAIYIHSMRRLRYTVRVTKGDSTYLEIYEGTRIR